MTTTSVNAEPLASSKGEENKNMTSSKGINVNNDDDSDDDESDDSDEDDPNEAISNRMVEIIFPFINYASNTIVQLILTMACTSFCGFQSLSKMMTVSAAVRLMPTPPALVDSKNTKLLGSLWYL